MSGRSRVLTFKHCKVFVADLTRSDKAERGKASVLVRSVTMVAGIRSTTNSNIKYDIIDK